ncbi:hypothetical protein DNTS_014245 [Danionella cerebrum]|uniref:P2Y purinoceptor 2 n=1 Tax=Danionella cerebrum TaxID=2873325 RepID=A0A553RJ00_9TELE|nr:hypothetical protein DNTS_014245 [Danionella translucida]
MLMIQAAMNSTTVPTHDGAIYRCILKEDFKYILLPVSYSLVFVVGLGLNLTALYFIVFRTTNWKPSTIYMINLNVCDTLYILTLPFLIYYYADENDWPFGEAMCKLIRFLFYTNLYGSILFLSCISLHRFIGVCHPMRSLLWMDSHRARWISVGIWVIVLLLQAPVLYFSRISSVVMILLFVLPFGVVLVCNGLILKKLREPGVGDGPTSQRSKHKSMKMIIIVLLVFFLCFLPFHVNRTIYNIIRYFDYSECTILQISNDAYKATRPLVSLNSCIDPILYFMAGQRFKNAIQKNIKPDFETPSHHLGKSKEPDRKTIQY